MASGLLINATTLAIWAHYYRSPNNGMTLVGDDIPFNISKFVDQIPSLLYWVLFLSTAIALVIVGDRRKWHSSKGLFVATVILTCSIIGLFVALVAVHRRNMQFLSIYCNLYEIPSKADIFLREQGKILIDQEDVANRSWARITKQTCLIDIISLWRHVCLTEQSPSTILWMIARRGAIYGPRPRTESKPRKREWGGISKSLTVEAFPTARIGSLTTMALVWESGYIRRVV
jgi:hypothetical protein